MFNFIKTNWLLMDICQPKYLHHFLSVNLQLTPRNNTTQTYHYQSVAAQLLQEPRFYKFQLYAAIKFSSPTNCGLQKLHVQVLQYLRNLSECGTVYLKMRK